MWVITFTFNLILIFIGTNIMTLAYLQTLSMTIYTNLREHGNTQTCLSKHSLQKNHNKNFYEYFWKSHHIFQFNIINRYIWFAFNSFLRYCLYTLPFRLLIPFQSLVSNNLIILHYNFFSLILVYILRSSNYISRLLLFHYVPPGLSAALVRRSLLTILIVKIC